MACDTQVTAGNSKRTDGTKLRTVEFGNMSALIAQAGSLTHTNRYIDILSKLVKDKTPSEAVEVGQLMNEAMESFRQQLRASHFNCSSEELDAIFSRKDYC
jgi:ATP-dependent protease HslVU (ClpYQ) peptidase subunit